MEWNIFIQNFLNQFDEINSNMISSETKFRDLEEWSSLVALSIIAMIDEEYNVILRGDDILKVTTIGELFKLVKNKL
jgi:acyl carrier protein